MKILQNQSLKKLNTFEIEAIAKYFVSVTTEEELCELITSNILEKEKFLIMGGGSNLIFVNDFEGIVVKIDLKGIEKIKETEQEVYLRVKPGEVWNDFVQYCIKHNWGGLENLSAVPGNVGASPIQNMGAYGVESKDYIKEVETIEIATGNKRIFTNAECEFNYRSSIFKTKLQNKYIVISVVFALQKNPVLQLNYSSITQKLEEKNIAIPSIADIANVIFEIRNEKLPQVGKTGSVGSFFKNPSISNEQHEKLKQHYPTLVSYSEKNGWKLAAAWLIEQCGWKGKSIGGAGVYEKQALILINLGNATGKDVLELSTAIQKSVKEKFDVKLELEAILVF